MFGDTSNRTSTASKNAISIILAVVMIIVGMFWYVGGNMTFASVVKRSSSPIGTQMVFGRSDAKVTISDLYTDQKKKVLIARLSVAPEDSTELPFKGSDYKVYISSKSTDGLKEMPVLFGRMSTEGDMFLIIPNPTDAVYSIFVMNTNYIATNGIQLDANVPTVKDLDNGSIADALAGYKYDDRSEETSNGTYTVKADGADVISFRLTLNPAFKNNDAFRAKVVKADLLLNNEDGSQEFDFKTFFDVVFKDSAIKELTNAYNRLSNEKIKLENSVSTARERLLNNPNDKAAKAMVDRASESLKSIEKKQQELSDNITSYSGLEFDESLFNNMQTKAKIVPSKK